MLSLLENLYFGNIAPGMDDIPPSPEYRRLRKLFVEREEALLQILGKDPKEAFLLYSDAESDLRSLSGREDFVRGFRLGAQLLLEMLKTYQNPA